MPIVEATGVAAQSNTPGLGKIIEKAMSDAVLKAAEDGVTDPVKIRERMMAAREEAKRSYLYRATEAFYTPKPEED